jgi:subtilisin family serine protease
MRKVNQRNNTNSLLLALALDWLVAQQVKVINLSLGGPKDEIMSTIFKLLKKPIVLVTAAGNSGPKALTSFPVV